MKMATVLNRCFQSLSVWGVLLAAVSWLLSGCAPLKPQTAPPLGQGMSPGQVDTPAPNGSPDLLRKGDALVINFSGVTDPPEGVQDRIREDGKITLSYVGDVVAAGKTRAELQKEITDLYVPRLFTRLDVTVNPDVRYIYVSGEVKLESRHVFMGGMTVMRAVATAGGFTDFANIKKVQLLRAGASDPIILNCEKARQDSELDLPVYPDDRIFVPRRLW